MSSEEEFFEVDKILDSKIDEVTRKYRYRIRWKGYGPDYDTWEPTENLGLCLDLLKNFKEEKRRKKLLKKQKMLPPPIDIKPEPISDDERGGGGDGEESDKDNDNNDDSCGGVGDHGDVEKAFLDGLTRRQKQQYLEVLEKSKTDLRSPTSSSTSTSISPTDNRIQTDEDAFSESSEIFQKKKKGKKKMVLDDTDTEDDASLKDIPSTKKQMPSEILNSVFHPNKKTQAEIVTEKKGATTQKILATPKVQSKSSKVLNTMTYIPLVDQLQERTDILTSPPSEQKRLNLKKVPGNIQYEDKQDKKQQQELQRQPKQKILQQHKQQQPHDEQAQHSQQTLQQTQQQQQLPQQAPQPQQATQQTSLKKPPPPPQQQHRVVSGLDRPPIKRLGDIKNKILNLQNLTNKRILVTGNLSSNTSPFSTASKPGVTITPSITSASVSTSSVIRSTTATNTNTVASTSSLTKKTPTATKDINTKPAASLTAESSSAAVSSPSNLIRDVLFGLNLSRSSQKAAPSTTNDTPGVDVVKQPLSRSTSLPVSTSSQPPYERQSSSTTTATASLATASATTVASDTVPTIAKKISKRTSSDTCVPPATEDLHSRNNKKEKSKHRLSIREYQAKKQRKSSSDEGFFLEFTQLPSSNSLAKAAGPIRTGNSLDNATIIPPKPTEHKKRTQSTTSQAASFSAVNSRVPNTQLATGADVLGNILQSINPYNSKQVQQQTGNDGRAGPSDDADLPSSHEDIILEEGSQQEDESSDFEDDLEECSSDEEFVFEEQINRTNHLQTPGANSVQMDHVFVNQCICKGDVDTLIKCNIRNEMINEYVDGEDPLLMKAVMECAPDMVRIMLEKGADPNAVSKSGRNPLMMAVELRQKKLVSMLIHHGAHLNMQTSDGKSALDMACSVGSIEIVHLLLVNGVDVKPTMESLNKANSRNVQVPQHLIPVLTSALNIHFEKLSDIVQRTLDVVKSSRTQLGSCLMPVRCISPKEYAVAGHTLYFDATEVNVTEKHQNMILVAVPVIFERNGQIRVVYDVKNNGVKDVILNPGPNMEKATNVQAIEGSNFIHILFPTIPSYNELLILTDESSSYKILVSVYTIFHGRTTVVPHHRTQTGTTAQPVNPLLSVR